ncbi:hypothetical protein GCM10023115_26130 [Pontixanthobacter gangjinensis]|uniref:Alpha/beta hydrolase n=1 Tax=Christiangramia aestuarii TaxID=1028746 RepID=A0A7K1LM07_9FLAO|nr:hypothetical protein [Christiangramia aestuarii]MUP41849.1 hypothetical protein [Christiangramia aestuarii]
MKNLLLAIFVLSFINITAQEYRIKRGETTDSLPIPGDSDKTYSLYLPRDYSPEKQWATIFVFDPQGRGTNTANLFRMAAEEQQYIVASANLDLKSQPIDSIIKSATSMVNGILQSLPVDPELVYSAGMGEGAQVSSALAHIYKNMAGVMAIGNSFVNPAYIDKTSPYMFIGAAGKKDYMVYEIEKYLKFYDDLNFPTEVHYFDGKEDEWPEAIVVSNAMTGFTLQAIRDGLRPNDASFVQQLFEKEMEYAESLRRTRNYYAAYEKLERMEEKYEGFGFEDTIENKMKEIKTIRGFRSQRSDFRQAISFEKEQQREYEYLLESDIRSVNFENIGWWAYQIDELEKLKEGSDIAKSNMAHRLVGYLDFLTKREYNTIMEVKVPIDVKIFISVLRTAINKNAPEAYLNIISLAAADGDQDTALLYLEDLLKTGYSDMESLYNIEGALDLQFTPEYNRIVKKYLGESKFFKDQEIK